MELPHRNLKGQQRVCDYCYKIEEKRLFWNKRGVPALQTGAIMIIHNRFTTDSRLIKLSDNEQCIAIMDTKGTKLKDSFTLCAIDNIVNGKTTSNLKKSNNATATQCFAVVANKTYEFEAPDKKTKDIWCKSLNAIMFINKQVDPTEIGQKAKEQYMSNQYDKAKMKQFAKNQKKRDQKRAKYKLNK